MERSVTWRALQNHASWGVVVNVTVVSLVLAQDELFWCLPSGQSHCESVQWAGVHCPFIWNLNTIESFTEVSILAWVKRGLFMLFGMLLSSHSTSEGWLVSNMCYRRKRKTILGATDLRTKMAARFSHYFKCDGMVVSVSTGPVVSVATLAWLGSVTWMNKNILYISLQMKAAW